MFVQKCRNRPKLCSGTMCVIQLATDMQHERALTVKGNTPEMQSKLNNQHAPNQAAKHRPVPDTAELIRRHAAEQECSPDIRLFVKQLTGRSFSLNVHKSWDIGAVKSLISIVEGVPPDAFVLVHCAGRYRLENKYRLSDYDIADETLVCVVLDLRGD